jgi:hypothetical protein
MYRRITLSFLLSLALSLLLGPPTVAADIVVVMGSSAAPVTKDQVAAIYLGRSNTLKPLDLPESNVLRDAFYKIATDRDPSQVKAVWSRLNFTGQAQPPRELPDAAAIKKAVAGDPKLVGYIDKSDVDATVKIVLSLH